MSLFRTIVLAATVAGIIAGLVLTALQHVSTVPLILKAETFETASPAAPAAPAASTAASPSGAATIDSAPAAAEAAHGTAGHAHSHAATAAPGTAATEHHDGGWMPKGGFERTAYTLLANIVGGIGIALVLVALSELHGGLRGWREGIFWGLAGFAAFTLAPSIGMPPDPPGMPAADLFTRQVWWIATVALTAGGIALLTLQKSLVGAVVGIAMIVAPHVVGAPKPANFETAVPHSLTHDFVVAVIITSLVFWVVLGALAGFFRTRFAADAA